MRRFSVRERVSECGRRGEFRVAVVGGVPRWIIGCVLVGARAVCLGSYTER